MGSQAVCNNYNTSFISSSQLAEKQHCDLAELFNEVRVRDHVPQLVQCVVEDVHTTMLAYACLLGAEISEKYEANFKKILRIYRNFILTTIHHKYGHGYMNV